jgi:hypothetical protein
MRIVGALGFANLKTWIGAFLNFRLVAAPVMVQQKKESFTVLESTDRAGMIRVLFSSIPEGVIAFQPNLET